MQPFSVTCETCGARLKVRDESVVGEIHSCPKCASMVLIALPATGLKNAPPASADHSPSEALRATDVAVPQLADFSTEVDQLLQQGATADKSQGIDDLVATEVGANVSNAGAGSPVLLWSVVAATSLAIATLGGIIWRFSAGDASPHSVAVANASESEGEGGDNDNAATEGTLETEGREGDVLRQSDSLPLEGAEQNEPAQQFVEVQKPETSNAAPLPDLPEVSQPGPPSQSIDAKEPDQTSPSVDPSPFPQLIDPLGINPADLDLLLIPKGSESEQKPSTEQPVDEPVKQVVSAPLDDPLQQPPPARRFEPGSAALGPTFAEQFAAAPLAARMAARIPSVRWSGAPLNKVLSELTQLSGIPIAIDPETLRMAQIRADHKITLSQQNVAVESIVKQVAETLRLEVTTGEDQVLLTKANVDVSRDVTYRVDDLAPDQPTVVSLVKLIEQFVLDAADQSSIEANGQQIVVRQPARYQYEVLLFLERLRKARGLAPRSKYPTSLIDADPLLVSLNPQLSRNTTFAIVDWTPLADVFDYWQESSGLAMLVDWPELATIDRRPLATMAASADQLTWDQALDACLAPLDLGWVPVDGRTVQITTHTVAQEYLWVDFYTHDEIQQLPPRLRNAAGLREALADRCDPQSLGDAVVADDARGKLILVRGNREVHQAIVAMRDDS
jgi:hypothetical protein